MRFSKSSLQTILAGLLLALYFVFALAIARGSLLQDFVKFYAAAGNYRRGESLYAPVPYEQYAPLSAAELHELGRLALHPNLNLPVVSLVFLPFTWLPLSTAYLLWSLISLGLALASAWLIQRKLRADYGASHGAPAYLILLLFYFPALASIWFGQVSFLLLFLLALAWVAAGREKDALAGIALGLALVVKVNAGILVLVYLLQRRWKLAAWALATFALANLLGLAAFGLDEHLAYLAALQGVSWHAASWNASFQGFFSRIFGGAGNVPLLDLPWLGIALAGLFSLALVAGLAWAAWPRREQTPGERDLVFSLAVVAMLLISPLGWMYTFVVLLIPALVGWQVARQLNKPVYRALIALAWLLSTIPSWIVPSAEVTPREMFLWGGCYFYALLIFSGVLLAEIGALRRSRAARARLFSQ